MNRTSLLVGTLTVVAASEAIAGPVALGAPLGVSLGQALGALLGLSLGTALPIAAGGLLAVGAASLVAGIFIVRRKRNG